MPDNKVIPTLHAIHTAYRDAIDNSVRSLKRIKFPPGALRKVHVSADNYLVQLLPKYYLEDFHTTTLVYLFSYNMAGGDRPFLRLFLDLLITRRPYLSGLCEAMPGFTVEQEARSDGWIDILLINHTTGTAIIVENKIHASDQDRQIPRYHHEVTNRAFVQGGHYRVAATVYLTLTGHSPSYIGCTKDDKDLIKPICIAYAGDDGTSLISAVLEPGAAMSGCEPVKPIVEWYGQIIEDLSGRSKKMEIVQDFARNVVDDTKAMATIADVINGRKDIEAALCQELGDRIFAQMEKMPGWSVFRSKYPEGQEIKIECENDRWDYAFWAEGTDLSHGFVEKGKPLTKKEKADFAKQLSGEPQEYAGNYFCVVLSVDLSERTLVDHFTDAGVRAFISEIEAIIG